MRQPATPARNANIGRALGAAWILLLAIVVTLATPAHARGAEAKADIAALSVGLDERGQGEHGIEIELHRWSRGSTSECNRRS